MANNGKNKVWTVIKIVLALAAIGVAVYAIYRKFFQKKSVAELEDAEDCDAPALDDVENDVTSDVSEAVEETPVIPAEAVIANAEAMEA